MDPISTARYGMMTATAQLTSSASRIAASGATGGPDPQDAVNMVQAQQSFKADVDVIKVADSMWNSLLGLQAVPPNGQTA